MDFNENLSEEEKIEIRQNKYYTGLIYQDKFSLILLPFLYVVFKRHFVNNHDKHSWVFDTQY